MRVKGVERVGRTLLTSRQSTSTVVVIEACPKRPRSVWNVSEF